SALSDHDGSVAPSDATPEAILPSELGNEPVTLPELDPTGRGRHRRRDADHRRATVAVGYLRRSTDRQEQSIPDQKRAIKSYCAEMGLRLQRCYVDDAI